MGGNRGNSTNIIEIIIETKILHLPNGMIATIIRALILEIMIAIKQKKFEIYMKSNSQIFKSRIIMKLSLHTSLTLEFFNHCSKGYFFIKQKVLKVLFRDMI